MANNLQRTARKGVFTNGVSCYVRSPESKKWVRFDTYEEACAYQEGIPRRTRLTPLPPPPEGPSSVVEGSVSDAKWTEPLEPWLDKRKLAAHYSCSVRSIEKALAEGMPHARIFGRPKFKVSETEPWLEARGHLQRCGDQDDLRE